jgi:hypothetical protein
MKTFLIAALLATVSTCALAAGNDHHDRYRPLWGDTYENSGNPFAESDPPKPPAQADASTMCWKTSNDGVCPEMPIEEKK